MKCAMRFVQNNLINRWNNIIVSIFFKNNLRFYIISTTRANNNNINIHWNRSTRQ
jgi:hypothetical protein